MDRCCCRSARFWFLIGLLLAAPLAGCNLLATGIYVIQGRNEKAEFGGLVGKRVAVVCRPASSVQYRTSSVAKDLARQVTLLLEKNVPRIKLIKQTEVGQWTDENNVDDYVQIGKALNADMVVGIDLEELTLSMDQTLYQGKASIAIGVYDVHQEKDKDHVWEKHLPQVVYPPNTPIPASDVTEPQFRRNFVKVLAEQIARNFYEHDPTADVANDSTALN